MKPTYYTPMILVDHVEPYCVVMGSTSIPEEQVATPTDGNFGAPGRKLYV